MKISRQAAIFHSTAIGHFSRGCFFHLHPEQDMISANCIGCVDTLRVLFLSIDRKYFWTAVILVVVIFLFRPPSLRAGGIPNSIPTPVRNARQLQPSDIGAFSLFITTKKTFRDEKTLKRELAHLLTSLYVSKQRAATKFDIYEALRKGEIPIPRRLHSFLLEESQESGATDKKVFPATATLTIWAFFPVPS